MMNNVITKRSEFLKEEYYKYTPKSGLEVYVFPKKLSTTYALFATRYGSIDSRFKLAGDENFTEVPDGIFGSNSSASDVYYQGSADMWSYVSIPGLDGWIFGSNSNYSRDFTRMHYNSTCRHWGTSSQGTEN